MFYGCPRVNFSALDGQGDFLLFFIHAEDLNFHLLADLEDLAGMIDAAPGQLADVHQAVCASQVDKGAKVGEIADHATAYLTGFQLIEEFLAPALSPFLLGQALRKNQAVTRAINLDDLELQFLIFHALQLGCSLLVFAARGDFLALEIENLRDGHESTNAGHVDNQAALIEIDNSCLEQFVILVLLLGDTPLAFCICSFERKQCVPIRCFWLNDIHEHLVIQVEIFKGPIAGSWKFFG